MYEGQELCNNSSFEVDTSSWSNPFGPNGTITRDITQSYLGIASALIVRTVDVDQRICRWTHPSPASLTIGSYIIHIQFLLNATIKAHSGQTFYYSFETNLGVTESAHIPVNVANNNLWQGVQLLVTIPSAITAAFINLITGIGTGIGDGYYVDAVQFRKIVSDQMVYPGTNPLLSTILPERFAGAIT